MCHYGRFRPDVTHEAADPNDGIRLPPLLPEHDDRPGGFCRGGHARRKGRYIVAHTPISCISQLSHHTDMLVLTCSTTLLTMSLTDATSQISPLPPSTSVAGALPSGCSVFALSASYAFLTTSIQFGINAIGPHDGSELLDPSLKRY